MQASAGTLCIDCVAPGVGHLHVGWVRCGLALFALLVAFQAMLLALAFLLFHIHRPVSCLTCAAGTRLVHPSLVSWMLLQTQAEDVEHLHGHADVPPVGDFDDGSGD